MASATGTPSVMLLIATVSDRILRSKSLLRRGNTPLGASAAREGQIGIVIYRRNVVFINTVRSP